MGRVSGPLRGKLDNLTEAAGTHKYLPQVEVKPGLRVLFSSPRSLGYHIRRTFKVF